MAAATRTAEIVENKTTTLTPKAHSKEKSLKNSKGIAHNMGEPAMAANMEADIRLKFFVALGLSLLIVLLSPMGKLPSLLPIALPTAVRSWTLFLLATPVVFWCGSMFILGALRSLRSLKLDMSVLIAVGVLAAYLASAYLTVIGSADLFYEAAAMLVTFVLFGHWMEMRSRRGTSDALQALFKLVPSQARVLRSGKETEIPTNQVVMGDVLVLKPGDRVPVDGKITEGQTALDEALVTGESLPVEKKAGDSVIAGSINGSGSISFTATGVGADTTLARIAKLVETAQNSKAPGQRLADKAAAYLVVLAVGAGLVTFFAWRYGAGTSFLTALTFAISAIVIACPDALGLATPTAVAVGTGLGAKHNILIKDAATLEGAARISAVALDKTGTLTEGKPQVTTVFAVGGISEDEVVRLVAAAEAKSGHPLSRAVLGEAGKRNLLLTPNVTGFENLSGLGVKALVDEKPLLIGTSRLMEENKVDITSIEPKLKELLAQGETLMILAVDGKVAGIIGAADKIKSSAAEAIRRLSELGIETALITGDNKATAELVGKRLGISRVFAEVLPADKAAYVSKLQKEGKFVAMVGDGVNDAPALAQADIGIAIGAGTDVAIEAAKIVLMRSDPLDILNAIVLSKATVRKMKQNLVWASIYNVLAIPVAAGVFYSSLGWSLRPEISALLMSASSIIVASNAVMLKRAERSLLV